MKKIIASLSLCSSIRTEGRADILLASTSLYGTSKNRSLMTRLFLICVLATCSSSYSQTTYTLNLNDATTTVASPHRTGINIGSVNYYDSGQIYKNLIAEDNPGFEPVLEQQIWALDGVGTFSTTQFSIPNTYVNYPLNFFAGASFIVTDSQGGSGAGHAQGCSGTIASNTTGGSSGAPIFTVSTGCSASFAAGDIILIKLNQYPSPESCWESFNCGIWPDIKNGAKILTDSTTPYDGLQSLVLDVTAGTSASAKVTEYFDSDAQNMFVLLNGTYQVSGWMKLGSGSNSSLIITAGRSSPCIQTFAPTSSWTQFNFTCTFSETNTTPIATASVSATIFGGNGLGQVELDDLVFQKTSSQDSTNTTIFRDEFVAAMRTWCASSVPGPACLVRNWTNQNGETMANWTKSETTAEKTTATAGASQTGETTPRLYSYLSLVKLLNGIPYLEVPVTFTASDASALIDYLSSTNTTSGWGQVRANQGQTAPWVGTGGVFSDIYLSFCNECWNNSSFSGQALPYRSSALDLYYDYSNRAKDIYGAMRADSSFSNKIHLGFNLQLGVQYQLDTALSRMASATPVGAADFVEQGPYTQGSVSNWQTDADLWGAALAEPWVASTSGLTQFQQSVSAIQGYNYCGASGTSACAANVYEEANGTISTCVANLPPPGPPPADPDSPGCRTGYSPIDQTHEDFITAGAGEGVIAPLQAALNQQQLGITAQNYFAATEFQNGTLMGGYSDGSALSTTTNGSGTGLTVNITTDNGHIHTVAVASGGTGYATTSIVGGTSVPTLAYPIQVGGIGGAIYVTGVGAGGVVTSVTVASQGSNQIAKLWGACIDFGGATSDKNSESYSCRPQFMGMSILNQAIIGPEYACSFPSGPTYNWPGDINNGDSPAENNVPYVYPFCYQNGTTRAVVFMNTSLTSSYTVNFSGSNTPTGTCATQQFAPSSPDMLNESSTLTSGGAFPNPTSTTAASTSIATSSPTCGSTLTLPADSVTAIKYTIGTTPASTPTFSPAAGTYSTAQSVTINDSTSGSTVYYTTDGSTPNSSSTVYTGPVTISAPGATLKAIAMANGYQPSSAASSAYTITQVLTPTFSPAGGTYNYGQMVSISDATPGTTIYYTLNGGTPTTSAPVYSSAISVPNTHTLKAIALKTGYTNSNVGSSTYTMAAVTPVLIPAAGTYPGPLTVTISTASGANLYFTTHGQTPTTSAGLYSGPLTVTATETLKVIAAATGYTDSDVVTNVYTIEASAATPTFSPAAGTYTSAQSVTISSFTSGATVYYTTDGSTPTTSSSLYSGPVSVSASETLKAIAVKSGNSNSAVGSAAYTLNFTAATPTFSPGTGTYSGTQSVVISATGSWDYICFTVDGSTPTASGGSCLTPFFYVSPINVYSSETVKAMAIKSGYANSSVASATYTINP